MEILLFNFGFRHLHFAILRVSHVGFCRHLLLHFFDPDSVHDRPRSLLDHARKGQQPFDGKRNSQHLRIVFNLSQRFRKTIEIKFMHQKRRLNSLLSFNKLVCILVFRAFCVLKNLQIFDVLIRLPGTPENILTTIYFHTNESVKINDFVTAHSVFIMSFFFHLVCI